MPHCPPSPSSRLIRLIVSRKKRDLLTNHPIASWAFKYSIKAPHFLKILFRTDCTANKFHRSHDGRTTEIKSYNIYASFLLFCSEIGFNYDLKLSNKQARILNLAATNEKDKLFINFGLQPTSNTNYIQNKKTSLRIGFGATNRAVSGSTCGLSCCALCRLWLK